MEPTYLLFGTESDGFAMYEFWFLGLVGVGLGFVVSGWGVVVGVVVSVVTSFVVGASVTISVVSSAFVLFFKSKYYKYFIISNEYYIIKLNSNNKKRIPDWLVI